MTANPLCQHEFDDGGLCAGDAVPGTTRCAGHQDDGQPDAPVIEPAAVGAAGKAGAR
jgi:hypothetical protein